MQSSTGNAAGGKKKREKKVHFSYILTAGRSKYRQENIYRDKEETFLKINKLCIICSYI